MEEKLPVNKREVGGGCMYELRDDGGLTSLAAVDGEKWTQSRHTMK